MNISDIRWKQRFVNFEKAVLQLENAVKLETLSPLEKAGMIQMYEFTFELGWKTVKDYLEEKGVSARFPRDVIKEGFKYEILKDGNTWMDMLQKRNLMAHTYDEENADMAIELIINHYFSLLSGLYQILKKEL